MGNLTDTSEIELYQALWNFFHSLAIQPAIQPMKYFSKVCLSQNGKTIFEAINNTEKHRFYPLQSAIDTVSAAVNNPHDLKKATTENLQLLLSFMEEVNQDNWYHTFMQAPIYFMTQDKPVLCDKKNLIKLNPGQLLTAAIPENLIPVHVLFDATQQLSEKISHLNDLTGNINNVIDPLKNAHLLPSLDRQIVLWDDCKTNILNKNAPTKLQLFLSPRYDVLFNVAFCALTFSTAYLYDYATTEENNNINSHARYRQSIRALALIGVPGAFVLSALRIFGSLFMQNVQKNNTDPKIMEEIMEDVEKKISNEKETASLRNKRSLRH